jgi:hypothetical protein
VVLGFAVTDVPVVLESPVAGDHVYVVAPEAVSKALDPSQIVGELTVIVGFGTMVTVPVPVPTQPPIVPVMVYVVVVPGVEVTELPVLDDNVPDGDQEYVVAPLAVKTTLPPIQVEPELTVIIGVGLTVITTVIGFPTHPPAVGVIV